MRVPSSKSSTTCSPAPSSGLSKDAIRLLSGLAKPGAHTTVALDAKRICLVIPSKTVSLGRGTFSREVTQELVSADLVAPVTGLSGTVSFKITGTGQAHLARALAPAEDAFRAQHASLIHRKIIEDKKQENVTINQAESPLAWLRRRKGRSGVPFLDDATYAAGERLRRDLTLAQMLPRVTANWSADAAASGRKSGARGAADASDHALAARQRATHALKAVGPDFSNLLFDVCGFLKPLSEIERDRAWPVRSGKIILRLALNSLADHYGLRTLAKGPTRFGVMRHWTAPSHAVEEPVQHLS